MVTTQEIPHKCHKCGCKLYISPEKNYVYIETKSRFYYKCKKCMMKKK